MDIKIKNNIKRKENEINCTFKTYISKKFRKSHQSVEKPSIELWLIELKLSGIINKIQYTSILIPVKEQI